MSRAFVVCAACGARMRADRARCVKCGELLKAAVPAPTAPPALADWLKTTQPRNFAIGAAVVVAAIGGVAYFNSSSDAPQTGSRPASVVKKTAAPAAAAPASRVAPQTQSGLIASATAADSVRVGGAAFNSGDMDSAKVGYLQALAKKPNDPEALNGLGLVLERQGQTDDAIAKFEQAAAIAPTTWAYRFNLAHALGERGQWDKAIDEYRVASGLFPDDYATQYNLALAIHKKGDDEAAVPEFRKAIAMAPREPSFHLSLAMSLEKTGKMDEARQEYQQYLDMMPWAPEAEKLRAHLQQMPAAPARPGA